MLSSLIDINYCYEYLVNQISLGLLIYSHVPTAAIAVVFGVFLFIKTRKLSSAALLGLSLSFAGWSLLSITSWFAFLGSDYMMFTWAITDIFSVLFFFFSYYFLYTFIKEKDLPVWQKFMGIAAILPTLVITVLSANLNTYEALSCEAWEAESVTSFNSMLQAVFLLAIIVFVVYEHRKAKSKQAKTEVALAGAGVTLFLFIFFFFTSFLTNLIVRLDVWEYAYNLELYGLFGMPVFLIYLGYLIVKYKAYDLQVFTAQAFVILLIVLFASQFALVREPSEIILNGLNLVLVSWLGIHLARNVKKEVVLRRELEKQRQELAAANERLKDLDQLKSEFVSLATHQIRSPLTAIKGYASLALEGDYGPLAPKLRDVVQIVYDSCENLVKIVGEFLDISRIELGRMKYNKERFDLKELVEQTIEELRPNIAQAGLDIEFEAEDEKEFEVHADKVKIKQVVSNLIDNSIKYTPKGGLRVKIGRLDDKITVTIKDSGVGIEQEELTKLFDKFTRAKDANKTNVYGTGLGLYIAKQMVEGHGGKVWAESDGPGKGSSFRIQLDAAELE